jgi:hypothetical protein
MAVTPHTPADAAAHLAEAPADTAALAAAAVEDGRPLGKMVATLDPDLNLYFAHCKTVLSSSPVSIIILSVYHCSLYHICNEKKKTLENTTI